MKTFIKSGFWTTKKTGATPKGWLDLTKLIKDNSGGATGNYIPLTGTEEGKHVTGNIIVNDGFSLTTDEADTTVSSINLYNTEGGGWELNANYTKEEKTGYSYANCNMYADFFVQKSEGGYVSGIHVQTGVGISSGNGVGLYSTSDYSNVEIENKLIYAQRSYVERPETLINCLNNATRQQLSTIKSILGIPQT